jgi:hypothetical protein
VTAFIASRANPAGIRKRRVISLLIRLAFGAGIGASDRARTGDIQIHNLAL